MSVSSQELVERLLSPIEKALETEGISETLLAKQLKAELKARNSVRVKVKGAVSQELLPRGRRVIARSGTGESVIEWTERAWDVQQRARMDAQKLLGAYPAERHAVIGKDGEPQDLSGMGSLEAATRLVYLIDQARTRKHQDEEKKP